MHAASTPALTSGIEFSGTPARVTLDSGYSLAGRSFTVEAWIWLNAAGGDRSVLSQIGSEGLFHLLIRNDRLHLGFWNDDLTGSTPVPTGDWVHVAYRYDATTREQSVLLNGQPDGSRIANASFLENTLPLHIGGYIDATLNPFDGRILELRIWDYARTQTEIAGDRFTTPPSDAPGLDALFTFEGITEQSVPEATGQLLVNTVSSAVTVAEPVLAPARLADPAAPVPLPTGSLAGALTGYSLSPAPTVDFADASGTTLLDGLAPPLAWGATWLSPEALSVLPLLRWESATPEITFNFAERVRIDAITLYAANGEGADGVALPARIALRSPGGFAADFDVASAGTTGPVGTLPGLTLDNLNLFTEAVTLELQPGGPALALGEVVFDGAVLAEPRVENGGLSLPAKRFLGIDPTVANPAPPQLDAELDTSEARFTFPRAADDYGVRPVVEWSVNLVDWFPLPHAPSEVTGRQLARLIPPPTEGRAFFRLVFPDAAPVASAAIDLASLEGDSPLSFVLVGPTGPIVTPHDPASLQLIAINDQAPTFGEPLTTEAGGSLRFFADGSGSYAVPTGLPAGQEIVETFTYTVADRFGGTVRNSFTLTLTGENDAPTADNITATHSAGAVPAGIEYHYFEGDFSSEAAFDTATPVSSGRMPSFSLDPATATSGYGLEMTGQLFVPATGSYTFYLSGNNASVLDIGESRVVAHDPADPIAERTGTIELSAGTHSIRVRYFDVVEPAAELSVDYSGPGFFRQPIPAAAFPRLESLVLDPLASASDPDDGDVLRVSQIDGQPLDADTPVRLASGAEVQLNGDGTITYLPAPGRTLFHEASDTDAFDFTVSDAGGLSASATAQLQLARLNSAPVVNPSYTMSVNWLNFAQILAAEAATDAEGDLLLITHVNGQPLVWGTVRSLPSTARVSLSSLASSYFSPEDQPPVPFGLRYDAFGFFLFSMDENMASDAFTITVTDAAGAMADVAIGGTWPINTEYTLRYRDSRFYDNLGPQTAEIFSHYRFPLDVVVSVTDRQTGIEYGQSSQTLGGRQTTYLDFDLPAGIDLEGAHFFDRFDLEIDTPDGVPIHYGFTSGSITIESLYSTANKSFFRVTAATSPHWPLEVDFAPGGTKPYKSGVHLIETDYNSVMTVSRLGSVARSAPANRRVLEPTFAANIQIEAVCQTIDGARSRFTAQNLNSENIVLTVGNELKSVPVSAGETVEFEVSYLPRVPVVVREAALGTFDSSKADCPVVFDFTINPFCANTFVSFTQVINNNDEALTVRLESVNFPNLTSEPQVIGAGRMETIDLRPQGQNIQGTPGRLMLRMGSDGPFEEVATFTFAPNDC